MRVLRSFGPACALLLVAAVAEPASAAWNNVFQVCCNRCRPRDRAQVSYYAAAPNACCDPCPQPCPQPVCTTQYVQRCYYQPVTTYQTRTYYEPVTTYRTSYYYEPVTSYTYSCYYDPCTGCTTQKACPTTSYRLRSQCCAVQSWVQRCSQVPVTSYRTSYYYEPVTTCSTPQTPCCPTSAAAPAAAPCPTGDCGTQPAVTEQRSSSSPGVTESPGKNGPTIERKFVPTPDANSSSPAPVGGSSHRSAPPAAAPAVKLDRIVSIPRSDARGQIASGASFGK